MMYAIEYITGTSLLHFLRRKAATYENIKDIRDSDYLSRDDIYDFAIQVARGMDNIISYNVSVCVLEL